MRFIVHTTDMRGSVPCRVIGKLQAQTWRVLVGVGVGHLGGGVEHELPENDLPVEVRRPNATFFVSIDRMATP